MKQKGGRCVNLALIITQSAPHCGSQEEQPVYSFTYDTAPGDVDDLIYGECVTRPSER